MKKLNDDEFCEMIGVRSDGTVASLGRHPIPPLMKAKEVVRSYFGGDYDDEMSDSSMALQCCREVIDFMERAAAHSAVQPAQGEKL